MKIYFFINLAFGLKIEKLESSSRLLNFIELTHSGIIEYNSLIEKYGILVVNNPALSTIDCSTCSVSRSTTLSRPISDKSDNKHRIFFEKECTDNISAIMRSFSSFRRLGENSILVVSNPKVELDLHKIKVKADKIELNLIVSEILNTFSSRLREYKDYLSKLSNEICKDIETKRKNGIFDLLSKKDYVLLFFNRDYNLIHKTFRDLKRILLGNLSDSDIIDFLKYRVDEYLNNYKDPIWDKYFTDNGILDYETQEQFIIGFLLTDLLNIILLKKNINWIFKIKELNRNEEDVMIRPALKITVKTNTLVNFSSKDFVVRDDKNLIVKSLNFKINGESLDIYFDYLHLIKKRIMHLKIFITNSDKFYETDNISCRALN